MNTAGIQLFQLLKGRMGDRETEALVDYVDSSLKENKKDIQETNLKSLVTKEDLSNTKGLLKEDIAKTKEELKDDIAKTREELKNDIAKTREELKNDIVKTKEELKYDVAKTREELKSDIAKAREDIKDVKSNTVRWMFAFFITIMLTILGLYLKY